jgi:branched-chain amino acid transport system permease protein
MITPSVSPHKPGTVKVLAALWIALFILPLVLPNNYLVGIGVMFFINVILIASLNLIMGYCGQISLCHAGFFGLGAYTSGSLSVNYGIDPLLGILAAIGLTALAALIVAIPSLRLRGHYLAMATLGANAILSVLFVELIDLTGGPNGLYGVAPIQAGSFAFDNEIRFYYLAGTLCFLLMLGLHNLIHSRAGRAMASVSGSEIGAASLGINAYRLKVTIFCISAALAGLAGALYVHFTLFASPESFSFSISVLLLVMVAVGGWGKYWGGLLGAAMYTVLPELLRSVHDVELLVFGMAMIVVLMFFPGGLASLAERLADRWRHSRRQSSGTADQTPSSTAKKSSLERKHA